ncbi:MAG: amidohydrolase [Bacillota bacterium]|nr:MAG: amidohydrolase [Bacillota bacterium]
MSRPAGRGVAGLRGSSEILLIGRVIPCPGDAPVAAGAVLFRDGRVAAVGEPDAVREEAHPGAEVVVLPPDAVVLPGFVDGHCHLLWLAEQAAQLDLRGVRSPAELARRVAERAARLPAGAWIEGFGWDQSRFDPPAWPDRWLLDRAAPRNPVLLRRVCGHVAVANSAALAAAGVGRDTPDPEGGRCDRDPATGEPTGLLRERAIDVVAAARPEPGPEERLAALEEAIARAHAVGVTAVHTHDVFRPGDLPRVLALYRAARRRGRPIRAVVDVSVEALEDARTAGPTGRGDEWLRIGSIKFFADGSLGGRTAALSEPYADGGPDERGMLHYPPGELARRVREAQAAGFQVAIHAIGDRAVDEALAALAAARAAGAGQGPPVRLRHRVLHAQVLRPEHPRRMAELGVVAEIQPRFLVSDLAFVEARLGPQRSRLAYAWRALVDAGVAVSAGSDAPVEPMAPLEGIQAAVTRDDLRGHPPGGWHPEQRLTVGQAVAAYTAGSAFGAGAEGWLGTLCPGAAADAVVLAADPWRVPPAEIAAIPVLYTFVGGQPVHAAG